MTHRRAFDPYASCAPSDEAPPDCVACAGGDPGHVHDGGAVEPQDEPGGDDERPVDPALGDAHGGQEPSEGAESDLEQPETPLEQPETGESDTGTGDEPAPAQPLEPAPETEADVPDLVDDVLAWVGENPHRARAALAKEARRPKPRKKVTALERLVGKG